MSRPIWLLTLMLLATALPTRGQAHAGHDDAPGTGSAAIASRHVLTALSDRFEVVLKHDPLRGFFPDAFDPRKRCDVARNDRRLEARDARAAEHIERGARADAADIRDEQPEEIALRRAAKSVENVRVFADLEMR